jgi:hypothetical protein
MVSRGGGRGRVVRVPPTAILRTAIWHHERATLSVGARHASPGQPWHLLCPAHRRSGARRYAMPTIAVRSTLQAGRGWLRGDGGRGSGPGHMIGAAGRCPHS